MRYFGNYILELLKGPWPEILFIRHPHGYHQFEYEMKARGDVDKSLYTICADIPNHEIPLDPLGRWQAEETRKYLHFKPDIVYASYHRRTREGAHIIFPDAKIYLDPRLNEKDYGPGHMLDDEEICEYFPLQMKHYEMAGKYWASKIPGGDTYVDLYDRNHGILGTFREDWAGKKIAVIGHSAAFLSIVQLFDHCTPEVLMARAENELRIPNCGILHYRRGRFKGWKRGKYRLELVSPPYKLWHLTADLEKKLREETIEELKVLKEQTRRK